jgi:predicted RNase H-like HicB family nuclease
MELSSYPTCRPLPVPAIGLERISVFFNSKPSSCQDHSPLKQRWMAAELLHRYNRVGGYVVNYKVLLHESEEGFSVSCPGLPGCWSQGKTEEEALENIQDAIREYLAAVDDLVKGQDVREVQVPL